MSILPRPMTTDEARERVCCGPHHQSAQIHLMCVGSKCMAWRWIGAQASASKVKADMAESVATLPPATHGVCGYIGE